MTTKNRTGSPYCTQREPLQEPAIITFINNHGYAPESIRTFLVLLSKVTRLREPESSLENICKRRGRKGPNVIMQFFSPKFNHHYLNKSSVVFTATFMCT